MSEVTNIHDEIAVHINIHSDGSVTIAKIIGQASDAITLTPTETEELAAVLFEWMYPSRPA